MVATEKRDYQSPLPVQSHNILPTILSHEETQRRVLAVENFLAVWREADLSDLDPNLCGSFTRGLIEARYGVRPKRIYPPEGQTSFLSELYI